ncbi:MAG: pitrilysin family protein, partial [Bacteroidota bacterium]|nr:pitrilysin family protein [Bacteroidota bacterium]
VNTSIPDGEFRAEKNRLLSSLAAVRSNPGETGTRILLQELFGKRHVLARAVGGTARDIERLTVEDAQKFFETYYRPENTTIIVVGDVDFPSLKTLIHDRFGRWRSGREKPNEPSTPFPRIDGPRVIVIPDTSARFVQVRFGMRIPTRSHPDFPVVLVLNQVLGGGNDSRLYRTLWGKHTVMPSFYSSIGVFRSGGWLIASGSTPVSRLDSVLQWMGETIESLRREVVGKDELSAAQRALTTDYPLGFTTNKRMHEQLLEIVHFGLDPGELAAFPAMVETVTPEAILRVARSVCDPEGIVIVVVGNVDHLLSALEARYGPKLQVFTPPVTEE